MNKEQIEKAANDYIGHAPEIDEDVCTSMRREAFKAGAEWRIKSVWHKPDEAPERKDILIKWRVGSQIRLVQIHGYPDILFTAGDEWAYIEDLVSISETTTQEETINPYIK